MFGRRALILVVLATLSACAARRSGPVVAPAPAAVLEYPGAIAVIPPWAEVKADAFGGTPSLYAKTATVTELEEIEALAMEELREGSLEADLVFPDERGDRVPHLYAGRTGPVVFDVPMADDPRIEEWIQYLTGRGREWSVKWLARSTRYGPIFWEILDQYGLPRDLIFLSMIESGFSPKAYSWAHAAGAWQFMPFTGREYGLEVGFWVDERRDFERATDAAARHLRDLYNNFGDWYLAFAAYNAGSGKIRRAVRGSGTSDFWKLSRTWWLRKETRHYVPKLLAAARITKEPEKYGFTDVDYLPRLSWDVLTVTVAVDLKTVARACGDADDERLKLLNPALRTGVTPPGRHYPLRVPEGHLATCLTGLQLIPEAERMTFRYHEVQAKDSLLAIAKKYQTTPEAILTFNEVDEARIFDFGELVIPVPAKIAGSIPIVEPSDRKFRASAYGPDGLGLVLHTVQPGDSLWKIAKKYRVQVKRLRLWNGLWRNGGLKVGQQIRVYVGQGGAPSGRRSR